RYGKSFIPADMTIQDWGITYDELEPYYDKFERTAAISGKAGNIKGQIQPGGNPFEAPRASEYPLPPLTAILCSEMFDKAARDLERLARLYYPRRVEVRRLPVLRLLPALRLRGQRQRLGAYHGDSDCDAQPELHAAYAFVGHKGAQGFDRQEGDRRRLYQHPH